MSAGWAVPMEAARAIAVAAALAVGVAILLERRAAIQQTTLISAWWWSLAALASWSAVELVAAIGAPSATVRSELGPLRLAAIALSLGPIVALLGAKRPQDRAWNLVVGSFWAILVLPAAEFYFLHPGQRVFLGDVRALIVLTAVLVGPISFSATRFWLAAWLLAAGQFVAFSPYLVEPSLPPTSLPEWTGLMLSISALAIAWLQSRGRSSANHAADRLWLDFRDALGFFWAMRVQQRFNAVARQGDWDLELRWDGFQCHNGSRLDAARFLDTEALPLATFKSLLRRFVSKEWIAQRTGDKQPPDLE